MTSSPRLRDALALLLAAGLLAGASAGCETTPPPPSGSPPAPQASAVADAASSAREPVGARPPVQEANSAIVIGERQTFHSTVLGEDRTVFVHTPASYKQGKAAYPVLYLLDGEDHFHHTTGITTFLSDTGRAPEMIVIGVTNIDGNRDRDFTPTVLKDRPGGGGSVKFLAFLKDEIRPRIEGAYRTEPYRILVGHSLGGLFAIGTLTSDPSMFNAYVAISPSLWWDDKIELRYAERFFAAHADLEAFLYFTVGNEGGKMLEGNQAFAALLKARAPRGLKWQMKQMDRESHATIPHRSTYDALETLFAGWDPPNEIASVKDLLAHDEALSKRFHFEVKLTEANLNDFGYRMIQSKHLDEAIAAFKLNVQRYPDSANTYDSLGDGFKESGQMDQARANYEIAVRKAMETSDPGLEHMKAKLEELSKPKAK